MQRAARPRRAEAEPDRTARHPLPCTPHARLAHVDRGRQAALCMASFLKVLSPASFPSRRGTGGAQYLVVGAQYLVVGSQYLVVGAPYLVVGAQYLV